jgi:threonine/homoserine/homoserine lactone efflux protein
MSVVHPYAVAGFLVAVLPLVATPGASLTLLIQRVGTSGRTQAPPVILGTVSGLYIHATLAGAGLSALVLRSSEAFAVIRLAGAAYLIILGIVTWRSAAGRSRRTQPEGPPSHWSETSTYRQALAGNVLNPKAASIYLTLTPQFLDPHQPLLPQLLLLATAHTLLIAVWLTIWTLVVTKTAGALESPTRTATFNKVTGAVLIGMGLRAAAQSGRRA